MHKYIGAVWWRLRALDRVLLALALLLAASFAWLFYQQRQASDRNREAIVRNRAAITHLCYLSHINQVVWSAAVVSYNSLPDRTPDQTKLLQALRLGVAMIEHDRSCPIPARR